MPLSRRQLSQIGATTVLALSLAACGGSDSSSPQPPTQPEPTPVKIDKQLAIDFSVSDHADKEATVIFSDLPTEDTADFELASSHEALPEPFSDQKGWLLSGHNRSDDLLMALSIKVDQLNSMTLHEVSMEVEILTNVPQNCAGIGGAPGESVYVKLAATQHKPENIIESGNYRLNVDLGQQSTSGTEGYVVGNIANSLDCSDDRAYELKTLVMEDKLDVMSDAEGVLWLTAGFDSGFEGKTTVYITQLNAHVKEI
ncbi:hypothetical protein [Flocculibacter collagenilyticus]|uniref:hypothetical protein n=1 Tax=Flocculibacter collagenilyticus TaxID=2744479 RepID=UPI0018F57FDE|nr:hypothetical protein [Flocculibacter collagenilyticus]